MGVMLRHPSFFFDPVIEFLYFRRGQRREWFVSDESLDLIFRHVAVGYQRAFSDGEDHILVKPLVKPLTQRHAAFLGEVNVTVEVDQLMELLEGTFLCLAKHRFVHGSAVVFMSDDDTTLPPSVSSFSDRAVALRSAFCHVSLLS